MKLMTVNLQDRLYHHVEILLGLHAGFVDFCFELFAKTDRRPLTRVCLVSVIHNRQSFKSPNWHA